MGANHSSFSHDVITDQEFALLHRLLEEHGVNLLDLVQDLQAEDETSLYQGGAPPASKQAIRSLPCYRMATTDGASTCLICSEQHDVGCIVTTLPCGHMYHAPCIQQWLHQRCTCPVCRYELATDDPFYEEEREVRMRQRHELPSSNALELVQSFLARRSESSDLTHVNENIHEPPTESPLVYSRTVQAYLQSRIDVDDSRTYARRKSSCSCSVANSDDDYSIVSVASTTGLQRFNLDDYDCGW